MQQENKEEENKEHLTYRKQGRKDKEKRGKHQGGFSIRDNGLKGGRTAAKQQVGTLPTCLLASLEEGDCSPSLL